MRIILVLLFLLFYFVISIPMWIIGFFIGLQDKDARHRFAQPFANFGFKGILFFSGVKLTVRGKENQPEGAALYTFNHRGFFDIITGYITAPELSLYVAKKELKNIPLVSRWMRYMQCLFLDRGDLRQGMETISKGIELLKTGHSVYIAPEGTRAKSDEMLPFHEATFRLALKSKAPIVPIAIVNTAPVFEDHLPWIKPQHIILEYMEPIDVNELSKEEKRCIGATVHDLIQAKVNENLAELEAEKKARVA